MIVLGGLLAAVRMKTVLEVFAGLGCMGAALLSGNPRRFWLWALMPAMTLSLSKSFGPEIAKLGGETSFRLELADLFWAPLLVYILLDIRSGRRAGIRIPKVSWLWIAIMAMGAYDSIFGTFWMTAAHETVRMAKMLLLFWVICNEVDDLGTFLHAASALTGALVFQSLIGLVQFFTKRSFGLVALGETSTETINQLAEDSVRTARIFRVGGFMIHPNIFGIFLAIAIPLSIAMFLVVTGRRQRMLFILGVMVGMPALIATYSRSSWGSFAISIAVLLWLVILHGDLRRKAVGPAIVTFAALAVICVAYAGPIATRLFESKSGATEARSLFAGEAVRMIQARPWFGWGLNSYALAVPPFTKYSSFGTHKLYQKWVPVVHNGYLLWCAETGIVGLLLHLGILAWLLVTAVGNLKVRNEMLFAINAACLCGVIALLVDGFNDPALRNNPMLRVFWVIAGLIMAVKYWRLRHETVRRVRRFAPPALVEAPPVGARG